MYAVEHGDFVASPERTAGTYSKYSSIDDKIDDLHYYTATFDSARIVGIEPISTSAEDAERVRFEYRLMTVLYVPTGVSYTVEVP